MGDSSRDVQGCGVEQNSQLVASFEKSFDFLVCHWARGLAKLFRRHMHDTSQRSKFRSSLGKGLHDFRDDMTAAFDDHALTFFHGRQELRQLVLRFCNAHRHIYILARF